MSLDVYLTVPEKCDQCAGTGTAKRQLFSRNITHNLGKMASEAGLYEALWRPEEIGATKARQLIPLLLAGLDKLMGEPEKYKQFDAPNGWGTYDIFVPWVRDYLDACERNPDADVGVWR